MVMSQEDNLDIINALLTMGADVIAKNDDVFLPTPPRLTPTQLLRTHHCLCGTAYACAGAHASLPPPPQCPITAQPLLPPPQQVILGPTVKRSPLSHCPASMRKPLPFNDTPTTDHG
jgi:hypothetical protein